jgi:hypothetical protein
MATLRAAYLAGEPRARPACRVSEGRVHDLNELGIPSRKRHYRQDSPSGRAPRAAGFAA